MPIFSKGEVELINAICDGVNRNDSICAKFGITQSTVKNRLQALNQKISLYNEIQYTGLDGTILGILTSALAWERNSAKTIGLCPQCLQMGKWAEQRLDSGLCFPHSLESTVESARAKLEGKE